MREGGIKVPEEKSGIPAGTEVLPGSRDDVATPQIRNI